LLLLQTLAELIDAHLLGPLDRMRAALANAGLKLLRVLLDPLTDLREAVGDFLS
jgi:hypothetical protein